MDDNTIKAKAQAFFRQHVDKLFTDNAEYARKYFENEDEDYGWKSGYLTDYENFIYQVGLDERIAKGTIKDIDDFGFDEEDFESEPSSQGTEAEQPKVPNPPPPTPRANLRADPTPISPPFAPSAVFVGGRGDRAGGHSGRSQRTRRGDFDASGEEACVVGVC